MPQLLDPIAPPTSDLEANKAFSRRFFAAMDAAGGMDAVVDLVASDCVVHFAGMPPLDRDGFRQMSAMFYAAFPDLVHHVDEQTAEGDRVVNRLAVRGTHRGEFQGIAPTGRRIEMAAISIQRVDAGRLVGGWILADLAGLLQQLGAMPAPGQ